MPGRRLGRGAADDAVVGQHQRAGSQEDGPDLNACCPLRLLLQSAATIDEYEHVVSSFFTRDEKQEIITLNGAVSRSPHKRTFVPITKLATLPGSCSRGE